MGRGFAVGGIRRSAGGKAQPQHVVGFVGLADVGLAVFFYLLTGFGVTVGFHRCLTHRSFTARPAPRDIRSIEPVDVI